MGAGSDSPKLRDGIRGPGGRVRYSERAAIKLCDFPVRLGLGTIVVHESAIRIMDSSGQVREAAR
jgi:hypothetical protein